MNDMKTKYGVFDFTKWTPFVGVLVNEISRRSGNTSHLRTALNHEMSYTGDDFYNDLYTWLYENDYESLDDFFLKDVPDWMFGE